MFRRRWMYFGPMFDADPGAPGGGGSPGGDPTPGGGPTPGADGGGTPPAGGGTPTPKMFTEEQVQAAIRGRLAEEQNKYKDHDRYKGIIENMSKMTGRSVEEIERELTGMAAESAQRQSGLPPQVYTSLTETNKELDRIKGDNLKLRLDIEEKDLKANPTYSTALSDAKVLGSVREYAQKMDCTMEQAFWATQGSTHVQQMQRETEQRILNQYKENLSRGPIFTDQTDEIKSLGLSPTELAYCQERGQDPVEYAALKNSNNIEGYRKFKKSKKAGQ
jgi:hypothetical protein